MLVTRMLVTQIFQVQFALRIIRHYSVHTGIF